LISHSHKCIFIHISKCAGSSIEKALGLKNWNLNYDTLTGWCPKNRLYLQHATPQQLLDYGYITPDVWNSYYKFVIIRNPWARAYSDYLWSIQFTKQFDTFKNFILGKGKFQERFSPKNDNNISDHLFTQKRYLLLNNQPIDFDTIIPFEELEIELPKLATALNLPTHTFDKQTNVNKKKYKHYSYFYSPSKKRLIAKQYKEDIEYLKYTFEDRKRGIHHFTPYLFFLKHPNGKKYFKKRYAYLRKVLRYLRLR